MKIFRRVEFQLYSFFAVVGRWNRTGSLTTDRGQQIPMGYGATCVVIAS
jgi:hypothetical protein